MLDQVEGGQKPALVEILEKRLGRVHANLRLGIEADHEAEMLEPKPIGNWAARAVVIRTCLRLSGLYGRGLRNARNIAVKRNYVISDNIPTAFDGYTILQLSDLHIDINQEIIGPLRELLPELEYDLCTLTGDYRGDTFGQYEAAIAGLSLIRSEIKKPVYGVLGNHDSIRMLPKLEEIGIRMLVNQCAIIERNSQQIYLAGIDDAHFYHTDNIEKAASDIPQNRFSILLSHTPETYQQAFHTGFNLLLSGHTHGGQICLPGGVPITLRAIIPRHMGSGAWKYRDLIGYTSVGLGSSLVPVRFNCPPEVTLHHLRSKSA